MPLFKILPVDRKFLTAEITSESATAVFQIVGRLDCKEADVLADDAYAFSLRHSDNGLWTIFQRLSDIRPNPVSAVYH